MEANTASQESENRITIGGKRKSSNRRSSILKATKSPLKAGVLEDIDPNSLDDNGRSRSKKSRRSSGRRVSFAEKNDIKEFFVEDWKSSSTKDTEDNLQVSSSASHGEYRAPAESIQGLESLLKGDIQGDDNQLCRAEIQEMPEVQYSQLSAASDNKVSYDRGILLQSVTTTQAQHTVPLDVTICHGPGIIGASQIGHQNPNANLTEQAEEMEYTKCHSSVMPGASTNMDQTRLFGTDTGIEVDVTCSQQEIFFRDYPNVQLSSPDIMDQSGKMDSKSFLMSLGAKLSSTKESSTSTSTGNASRNSEPGEVSDVQSFMTGKQGSAQQVSDFEENVELTACHSYKVIENVQLSSPESLNQSGKMDSKSFLMSLGAKPSSTNETSTSASFSNASRKRQPLGEITEVQVTSEQGCPQQMSHFDDNLELTACHSYKVLENSVPKTKRRSIYEPANIDITCCYGAGLMQSPDKQECHGLGETSVPGRQMSGVTLNLNANRKRFGTDLRGQSQPECTAQVDITNCYGSVILPGNRIGVDQTVVFSTDADNTDSLDLTTVCQAQEEHDSDENLELTACHSYEFLDNSIPKTNQKSICEPADLDVTSCYGPGLIKSPEKQISSNYGREYTKTTIVVEDLPSPDMHSFRNPYLIKNPFEKKTDPHVQQPASHFDENVELTVCHSQSVQDSSLQKTNRRSLHEPADIDFTSCYGVGLVKSSAENLEPSFGYSQPVLAKNLQKANRRSLYESTDIDVTSCYGPGFVPSSGETSVSTSCQSPPALGNSSQKTNRQSLYEPADIDVTSCYGSGLVKSCGENLEQPPSKSQPGLASNTQRANRRSLYEPADIDVTSCYGSGLVKSCGENLEQPPPNSQPGLASNTQRANRRSLHEPVDIDVTSCYGSGLVKSSGENLEQLLPHSQPGLASNTQRANRQSLYEPADIDVTSCYGPGLVKSSDENLNLSVPHSQPALDSSTQNTNQRCLYEPADRSVTSCHWPGSVKSDENVEVTVPHSEPALDNSTHKTNWQSLCEPDDLDATCHGAELVKSFSENSELSKSRDQQDFDNNSQITNRRNLYKPADLDVTCHGAELVKSCSENSELSTSRGQQDFVNNSQKTNQGSLYEPADVDVTSFHGAGLVKSFCENSEPTVSHSQLADDNIQQANRQSLSESAGVNATSCQGEEVTSNNDGETALNRTKGPETPLDPEEDMPNSEEVLQTSRVAVNSNASFESTNPSDDIDMASSHGSELNKSTDDEMTSNGNGRKLSMICEESVSELSRKEMVEDTNVTEVEDMQNTTQSPITLKEFLDLMEIAFIREVNLRRSIVPPDLVKAPQTPKDKVISSLVSKHKAACYEEAIPAVEAEIKNMRMKVEEQEMELNASNPRVFMEAQAASKEELLEMQNKVRRLRSTCEKTTKREWKEGKGQLNKRILTKITENHQALASDVHVVEESLSMVDDCFNLLDKMDNELDEGINYHQSIEENEKKLQEQATMVKQLEAITEALEKSEKELAELENKRTALQSEKQELVNRKEQLDVKRVENEEAIRLLKSKNSRSGNTTTKALSQTLDILESLQEWSLEEWDKEHARFTFLKNTLEMVVLFGSEISDTEGSFSNQEVKNIQLNFISTEHFTGKMGKVHTLVKQAVNQNVLADMCHSKKDLTKILEHMSGIVFKSNEIGKELFIIGLSHLMSFKENRFVVEFSSLKAFVKFVLHIQLELLSYPDSVTFTVSPMIGHLSQTEIEETLNTVEAGPRYLCRLVEAADELLNNAKPTSNMPS